MRVSRVSQLSKLALLFAAPFGRRPGLVLASVHRTFFHSTLASPELAREVQQLRSGNRPPRAGRYGAASNAMGKAHLDSVRNEARALESIGKLIRAGAVVSAAQGAYTTPEMVALERDNLDLMRQGRRQAKAIGAPADVSGWALQRGLSSEQTQAAQMTVTANDWITAIEGTRRSGEDHHGWSDSSIR